MTHVQAVQERQDLKIACIALVHDATLLTRNASDFARVPELNVEDWTSG